MGGAAKSVGKAFKSVSGALGGGLLDFLSPEEQQLQIAQEEELEPEERDIEKLDAARRRRQAQTSLIGLLMDDNRGGPTLL